MGTDLQNTINQWVSQYSLFIESLSKFNISENYKILIISFWDNTLLALIWFYAHSPKSTKWFKRVIFVRMGTPYFQPIGNEYISTDYIISPIIAKLMLSSFVWYALQQHP